jgi:S1-C subfamily serine protease
LTAALVGTACSGGDGIGVGSSDFDAAAVDLEQSDNSAPPSDVAEMIEDVLPSVVNVRVTSVGVGFSEPRQGEGSGVVIDKDGVILTNAHVVQGAVKVTVVTSDGRRELEGRVIGSAPERDLAVIDVDADLDPIEIGHSSPPDLRLGDQVVALGFPLQLGGPTVTQGIVSGLRRNIDVQDPSVGVRRLEGVLQTDAAINPGNSGGALVNAAGQLIGINSAGASTAENVGFAIAIDDALPVVEQILEEPASERAWLGVYVGQLTPPIASQLGLPSGTRGALIDTTIPGGPAEEAGLEAGDVIVAIGDREVTSTGSLTTVLGEFSPGDEVTVEVIGPNGSRSVELVLEQRPATL